MTETTIPTCAGLTGDGAPCRVPPKLLSGPDAEGRWWCASHDPDPVVRQQQALASQRGAAATRARHRKLRALDRGELGPLDTPEDAQRWAATIARAVAEGRLAQGAANAATRALNQWLNARDLNVRESRLRKLENEVARLHGEGA